ncbi:MAG: 3-deoxy-7-phosphoheptulonate synthase [Candidatus Methanomethyliaceae archaeon]|nr:3-deoxy-7-phosphoheptulonate synthase [Candidatus Methanomethyliaceae archaeon]
MIISLRERSEALEKEMAGKIWLINNNERAIYVIKGKIPEKLLPQLEIINSQNISTEFELVSREYKKDNTCVKIGDICIGEEKIVICAGPCAVEGKEMLREIAKEVKSAGASILRGGAFKPRTSPYSFQGLKEEGLKILREIADEFAMPIVTEVMSPEQVELVSKYADLLQIGARNMQNFELLKAVGRSHKPILLKRGMAATIEEWLLAAEYILLEGNKDVILCERGIRSFENAIRNVFDVSSIALIKLMSHLPIIADPSHATGRRELVIPISKAAIAIGADGLLIEVHSEPTKALSDGPQSLTPMAFRKLMEEIAPIAKAIGRSI